MRSVVFARGVTATMTQASCKTTINMSADVIWQVIELHVG
jgi:hypothetical protein